MVYQIVFNVSYPIYDDERTKEELRREICLLFENHELFNKNDKFQINDSCWFVSSNLSSNDLYKLMRTNQNINIIISQINHNIFGYTFDKFWKWLREKNIVTEEMCENEKTSIQTD